MVQRFDLNDLTFLHKIIHKIIPVDLPYYLKLFDGNSRLRSTHYDLFSLVSSIDPPGTYSASRTSNQFANSYFYRTHSKWNNIPLSIRQIECPIHFKSSLKKHLWNTLTESYIDSDHDPGDTSDLDYN